MAQRSLSRGEARVTRVSFPLFRGDREGYFLDQGGRSRPRNCYLLSLASLLLTVVEENIIEKLRK